MMRFYGTFPDDDVERRLSAGPESDGVARVILGVGAVAAAACVAAVWLHVVSGRVMLFVLLLLGVAVLVGAAARARAAGPAKVEEAMRAVRSHPGVRVAEAHPVVGAGLGSFLGPEASLSFSRCADGRLAWHERVDDDGVTWHGFVMRYPVDGDGVGYFAYETARDRFVYMPETLSVMVTYACGAGGDVVFLAYEGEGDVPLGRMPLEAALVWGDGSPLTER